MIILTKPGGARVGVNLDLVRWVDDQDGTLLVFLDGAELAVAESIDQVAAKVREQRAAVLVAAKAQEVGHPTAHLRVLPGGEGQDGDGPRRAGPGAR